MKTIEQLNDLVKELNSNPSYGVLKFKVINNKHGTGIRVRGAWGRYGGLGFKTKTTHNWGGLYQGFGRTDEEFVAELKRDVEEVIENLVRDYNKCHISECKFNKVMEQYLKNFGK